MTSAESFQDMLATGAERRRLSTTSSLPARRQSPTSFPLSRRGQIQSSMSAPTLLDSTVEIVSSPSGPRLLAADSSTSLRLDGPFAKLPPGPRSPRVRDSRDPWPVLAVLTEVRGSVRLRTTTAFKASRWNARREYSNLAARRQTPRTMRRLWPDAQSPCATSDSFFWLRLLRCPGHAGPSSPVLPLETRPHHAELTPRLQAKTLQMPELPLRDA